jgi:predicted dehydrogenase
MPNVPASAAPTAAPAVTTTPASLTSTASMWEPPARAPPAPAPDAPRVLVVGAGSRGLAYALATEAAGLARISAVAEPRAALRAQFGARFVWGADGGAPADGQEFDGWEAWVTWEAARRAAGGRAEDGVEVAFVCVMDDMHLPVVRALARLGGVHIMCEKPLAPTLADCLALYRDVREGWRAAGRETVFGIGHVLRYAPHNVLLRRLVREERVVGDIMSIEHTEPVGWWHFAHSFVRRVSLMIAAAGR